MKIKQFFIDMLKGVAIGIAMIIPGVSGGTLAVLLDVYDKIINAVSNLRKDFKGSFTFLLPIALGIIIGFLALLWPLNFALEHAYLPTILLFMGLMCGSCPKMIRDAKSNGLKKADALAIVIPFVIVIGLCFITGFGDVDLGENMQTHLYFMLVIMGALASCALVIPGISGSMLMMLFGFYQPIIATFKTLFSSPLHSIVVLALFAVGIIIGFFTITKLMQLLLKRFPRATFWAIVGFVIGSIPAILIVFFKNSDAVATVVPWQIGVGCVLFVLGGCATFFIIKFTESKLITENKPSEENKSNEKNPTDK